MSTNTKRSVTCGGHFDYKISQYLRTFSSALPLYKEVGTLRLRTGASIENVIAEKSLDRIWCRLCRKFGIKIHLIQYV